MNGGPDAFLGQGWRFPLLPDASGRLSYAAGEESVRDCLLVLVRTALGERVMRPEIGTRAPELVFSPGSARVLRQLEDSIGEAIRDFEPRAAVDGVRAQAQAGEEWRVTVFVDYRVRTSGRHETLVFPYYLDGGSGLVGGTGAFGAGEPPGGPPGGGDGS
ncbi:GPW/gp25 family protein [Streptomyces yerevanensis]|uniref:GPW/gp25 family protein n=1 Tax=Streptomyces yerevanensis TaxID=66378 RepID=UPI00068D5B01|nr:GPW/gp25 family protein [Streptomyces yerevanensis]